MEVKKLIVAGLNRYLNCDTERASGLLQIDHKIIGVRIKELDILLALQVNELSLEEVSDNHPSLDVEIILSLKTLPHYFLGVDQNQLIKNGNIEIIGDSHVASVFHNTLKGVEIDWEELLAKYTGDVAAYQIGLGVKNTHGFLQRLRNNMRLDIRDYLQDDLQIAATQVEVEQFIEDVDTLRAQTDRLEARIKRLFASK